MAEEGTFQQVGNTEQPMYGQRALLVCGYDVREHPLLLNFIQNTIGDISVIFVSNRYRDKTLDELVRLNHETGKGETSDLRRAVIMSGLTESEFHRLINTYHAGKLPAQLWATLTPHSEKWTVAALLDELAREQSEIRAMMRERRTAAQSENDDAQD